MRLLIITAILCTSCVSNTDAEAHRLALWNFKYEADINNEYRIYNSIDKPFYGDCDDFALTLQKVIGGNVWYIYRNDKAPHAALVKNDLVYDNEHSKPVAKSAYAGEFLYIIRSSNEK